MPSTKFSLVFQGRNIALNYNSQLTQSDIPELQPLSYDGVVAQVNPNPNNLAILGLKNCSTQMWTATLPTGEIRQIQTGQTIKLDENTQINFGLINGIVTSRILDKQDQDARNKIKSKSLIIVSIIALTLVSPILIYALSQNQDGEDGRRGDLPGSNSCDSDSLNTRRKVLGISTWYEVNRIFREKTGLRQKLDPNDPNYDYNREQWCKIADDWLKGKELKDNSPSRDTIDSTTNWDSSISNLSENDKIWQGYFDSKPAKLVFSDYKFSDDTKMMKFRGKLTVESENNNTFVMAIEGILDTNTNNISFKETKLLEASPNTSWYLGSNQGTKSTESMTGNGSDSQGHTYLWCFDHINAVKTCTN